jgi:hypothetical protein
MWTKSTIVFVDKFRCRKCSFGADDPKLVDGEHVPFIDYTNLRRHTPGNFFKCPLGMCNRGNLSFEEFFSQTCCGNKRNNDELKDFNDAEKIDHDYMENLMQAHKKLGGLKKEAKEECENAKKTFENAKKTFEKAKEKLEKTEEKFKNIEDKMALYFVRTATAITEGNLLSDRTAQIVLAIPKILLFFKGKPIEEDPRLFCKICCEKYNETDRVRCVLPCRHSSCEKCLTAFPNKTCSVCRTPFTDNQIMKLFD